MTRSRYPRKKGLNKYGMPIATASPSIFNNPCLIQHSQSQTELIEDLLSCQKNERAALVLQLVIKQAVYNVKSR